MSRVTILLLRRELCKFEIYWHLGAVEAIIVEMALGCEEKRNILKKKKFKLLVKTMFCR